jgi:hypothetical protein
MRITFIPPISGEKHRSGKRHSPPTAVELVYPFTSDRLVKISTYAVSIHFPVTIIAGTDRLPLASSLGSAN